MGVSEDLPVKEPFRGKPDRLSDIHITRELLRAVARGELSERALAQIEAHHLESLCPVCRREMEAWREERTSEAGYEFVLQALPAALGRHASDLLKRSREAERDLKELLAIPPEERLARIARARSRFRGPVLAERLIEESRRLTPADPREGYDLAEIARAVVQRSPDHPDTFSLLALASSQMANACRAGGELRRAGEHFQYVRYLVGHEGVTDPLVLAQIDHLEGSLRKDQRRFDEAEALLTRAAMLFRISGASVDTARALCTLGALFFQQGRFGQAIETTEAALEGLSSEEEPRLYLMGRHNLALYLAEAERFAQAAGLVAADEDLYRRQPEPWTQLRLSWLRGKIAAGLGETAEAERFFRETRDGFMRQGNGYDAAMASLDLALLYLKEGRTADVLPLAEEMVKLFEAQDVHREALAAVLLFQEAARREEVTAGMVRELAGRLETVRRGGTVEAA
jgi:tetratricopeptide (TPR) repeat protein